MKSVSSGAKRIRVFLTAPNMDFDATGESFVAWRWAEALSHVVDLTIFTLQTPGRISPSETLPAARVLTEPLPRTFSYFERFEAMAKPYYPQYMRAVRRALGSVAGEVDIAHQIMPQAARFPSPLRGQGLPYVLGPVGGALTTPDAFRLETRSAAWFTRLRALDSWRFRHDYWLRRSYSEANLLLGVGPYMREVLRDIPLQRFESVLELGIAELPRLPVRSMRTSNLRLLHIGRGVRTKGLRDVVRAMGLLKESNPDILLDSAGVGEEIDICRAEAKTLGIADRITFHGSIPREKVDDLYERADLFVFPSFREPAGNVIYEAMSWGLPVIVAARGGPDWIVDDNTGIRVPVTNPVQFASDVAKSIVELSNYPAKRQAMGEAARSKVMADGFWPNKAARLVSFYDEVLSETQQMPSVRRFPG